MRHLEQVGGDGEIGCEEYLSLLKVNSQNLVDFVTKGSELNRDRDVELALTHLLDQLIPLSLDRGFSVQDIELMVRLAATKGMARKQIASGRRLNISGIAASTGLSRADVAALCVPTKVKRWKQKPVDQILSAWLSDRKYSRDNSRPLELRIYGRSPSFQSLVDTYGAGLPVRAILDELVSRGDVTLSTNQSLKISSRKREPSSFLNIEGSLKNPLATEKLDAPTPSLPPKRKNLKRR